MSELRRSRGDRSVDVNVETLSEAVSQAVSEFKEDKKVPNPPGQETEFRSEVLRQLLKRERGQKMLVGYQ
jgi:hypothetical protein